MDGQKQQLPIEEMSFEDSMLELEQIVRKLETGQGKLDDAVHAYERGAQLRKHCERKLNEAQMKVEKVVANDGQASHLESLDEE